MSSDPQIDSSIEDEPAEPVRLPKKNLTDDEMDITPMIDITFLLLIFFLVASKINADAAVNLPQARNGTAVAGKDCVTIIVKRGNGETAEVLQGKDGTPFPRGVEAQAEALAEYVQAALDAGKTEVMIKAEAEARMGEVKRVEKAVSESMDEGKAINIAIVQEN